MIAYEEKEEAINAYNSMSARRGEQGALIDNQCISVKLLDQQERQTRRTQRGGGGEQQHLRARDKHHASRRKSRSRSHSLR